MSSGTIHSNAWKSAGYVTGTSPIDISGLQYSELMLELQIAGGENRQLFPVPQGMLAATTLYMRQGGYGGSVGSQFYTVVGVSLSSAFIVDVLVFGTNYKTTSILRVWYR